MARSAMLEERLAVPRERPMVIPWLVGFVLLFAWTLRPIWSIDVFLHVAIGRDMLANGLRTTDVFSAAHPDASWTSFQVGYACFAALLERLGGLDLLRVVHAALFSLATLGFVRAARREVVEGAPTALLLVIFLVLFEGRIRLRPHVFNLLFEVFLLLALARMPWRKDPARWLAIVTLSGFVWGTIHSLGALWVVCFLGTVLVLGHSRKERLWGGAATACSLAAILLAPGGYGGIAHVLSIQHQMPEFVPELAPSWRWFMYGTVYGVFCGAMPVVVATGTAIFAVRCRDRDRRMPLLMALGLSVGAVAMVRLGYYAAFALVIAWPEWQAALTRVTRRPATSLRPLYWGAFALGLAGLLVKVVPRYSRLGIDPWTTTYFPGQFPVQEVEKLAAAGIHGRIFNHPQWGGYLLYKLHPPSTVISDGRITFSEDVADHLRRAAGPRPLWPAYDSARDAYGIDLLVLRRGTLAPHDDWVRILSGPLAEIWVSRPRAEEARRRLAALRD